MQPRCAGQESRFGVIDHLGKTHYLAQRYGTAEALGCTSRPRTAATPAPRGLSRTPSAAELDLLLKRRSRARGRGGGPCSTLCDVVQTKWSVIYAPASSGSWGYKQ